MKQFWLHRLWNGYTTTERRMSVIIVLAIIALAIGANIALRQSANVIYVVLFILIFALAACGYYINRKVRKRSTK